MTTRILIVGGGIGGLAAAAALARFAPAALRVVEQAPAFEPVGAGITVQANATAVLRALGIELPAEDVVPIGSVEVVNQRGVVLTGGNPAEMLVDPPSLNIHRADLHRALLRACEGVELVTDRVVDGVESDADGVGVRFSGGDSERWDLVIGADGAESAVRRSLDGGAGRETDDDRRYSGQTCWRFALEAPDLVPAVTVERWTPGRRAGIVPMAHGRIYVYLVETAPRGTVGPGSATAEAIRERFLGVDEHLDPILERLDASVSVHHDDLCDRTRVHFGGGRVLLIGDAAHPMTPNVGQGAGTAIEDVGALALFWQHLGGDPPALIAALDALRRPRVEAAQRLAWRIGQVAHWEHPLACWLRDLLLRAMPQSAAERQARQMWQPGIDLAARLKASQSGA